MLNLKEVQKLFEISTNKKTELNESIKIYNQIISQEIFGEDFLKIKEDSIKNLCEIYKSSKNVIGLVELAKSIRSFLKDLPRAKAAKIVKTIIEQVGEIPDSKDIQIELCIDTIKWAEEEKRSFLRQRIETRLAFLYFEKEKFNLALPLIIKVSKEVRKLDDKNLLVEIYLLESYIHLRLKNIPKSKAALTSSRTYSNSIYCPPLLQSELDLQSGIVNCEEKDYKTGYSYFYEAFEGFTQIEDKRAILCLKYMLMCKVILNLVDDIPNILSSKSALLFRGNEIDSMKEISVAYQKRSLNLFEDCLKKYKKELQDDFIVEPHLSALYENLLEQHLLRIIEPYSRVEISHIAKLINLKRELVEKKLSQMILDKSLNGILDQGSDCLIVFEEKDDDEIYSSSLDSIHYLNEVLDSLFEKSKICFK